MNDEGKLLANTVNARLNDEVGQEQINEISNPEERSYSDLNEKLKRIILNRLEIIKKSLEERTKDSFKDLLTQTAGKSENFLYELATNMDAYLGMDFRLISEKFDLDIYTSFYLTIGSSSDMETLKLPIFNRLLPPSVRKKKLIKRLKDHYNKIIITDTAAIGYDLQYKIRETFRKFNYELNNLLKELFDNLQNKIEDSISSKKINEQASEAEIKKLHNTIEHLDLLAEK